jgi:glycosyltransferase involved in cell wall biosynthesis
MLSVIIPTRNSEHALAPMLAALVPGATAGLITEVLIADGGSQDDTAVVADVAGCNFLALGGSLGTRLRIAAAKARAPWLMFLEPGTLLYASWTEDVMRFIDRPPPRTKAAVFRRGPGSQTALREALFFLVTALGSVRPEQGLLIAKSLYDELGGHSETAANSEVEFLRRIGRRRIVTLASTAFCPR